MNSEIFKAIDLLEKEKGISRDYMIEKIGQALITAYKRDHEVEDENIIITFDEKRGKLIMAVRREVVEDPENLETQISLEDAKNIKARSKVGDLLDVKIDTQKFGRIAAQTAKQVIIQAIREAERGMYYQEFTSKEHEILDAKVSKFDPRNGGIILEVMTGGEKSEAFLSAGEQVPGEQFTEGDHIKIYVVEVKKTPRGPQVLISRTHPGLVRRLFETEVPEIHDGTVEVRGIVREAGSRTKIAVYSTDENVDPIGACVGPRGSRVEAIVDELHGEKIDIIQYSENPDEFIAAALSPSEVISVTADTDSHTCSVIVPDSQLSLAIGREGQNARLAAKLTGYKIDIKPESAQ